MGKFKEMKAAVDEAKVTLRIADSLVPDMISMVAGRLKTSGGDGYWERKNIAKLKRELRNFNITTKRWK